jgi:hypothetical protein
VAEQALAGVGDVSLGEWWERGPTAVHLRRRLSDAEVKEGDFIVTDLRGTSEAEARLTACARWLPAGWKE